MSQVQRQPAEKDNHNHKSIPEYARTALVPIANPATAADLLRIAAALTHPEEGKVMALIVSLGDVEKQDEAIAELKDVLDQVAEEGLKIELETITATSVARGILDAARELGADLVILGINRQRVKGQTSMGTVVENVMAVSPCDTLIYRAGPKSEFKRIVVPVNDTFQGTIAARIGIQLAKHFGTRVEAMYAQPGSRTQYEGLARIEAVIADLDGRERVKRTVINAQDAVEGILTRTDEDDLMIVGFSERSDFERWMFGDIARGMLNRAACPVIIVSRSISSDTAASRFWRRFVGWVHPTLTRVEQGEIVRGAQDSATFNIDYTMLILVSATLATLGLLLNSAAVIIGAMLVAPLMGPLVSLSTGLTVGRVYLAQRSTTTLIVGVLLALLVSVLLGLLLPVRVPTTEMLARGSPTLLDAAVALASGIVGAYATARKDIPAALAGVAIAAALMPPVCTIGLGMAFQDADLAFGATLLFLTNIICIIFAGVAIFAWLGMRFENVEGIKPVTQYLALAGLFIVAIPVTVQLISLTLDSRLDSRIHRMISEELDPAEVTDFKVEARDPRRVVVEVRASSPITPMDVLELENRVAGEVGEEVEIEMVVLEVIRLSVEPEDIEAAQAEEEAQADAEATPEATAEAAPE